MVFSPGSAGQVSLSAIVPPVLVMTRLVGARSGNKGWAGGASSCARPNWVSGDLVTLMVGSLPSHTRHHDPGCAVQKVAQSATRRTKNSAPGFA